MKFEITDPKTLTVRSSISQPINTIPIHPAFRRLLEEMVVSAALDVATKASTENFPVYRGRLLAFQELQDLISRAPEA